MLGFYSVVCYMVALWLMFYDINFTVIYYTSHRKPSQNPISKQPKEDEAMLRSTFKKRQRDKLVFPSDNATSKSKCYLFFSLTSSISKNTSLQIKCTFNQASFQSTSEMGCSHRKSSFFHYSQLWPAENVLAFAMQSLPSKARMF